MSPLPSDGAEFDSGTSYSRPRDPDGNFDGPLSGLFFEFDCRLAAVDAHGAAEGIDVQGRVALDSYDRVLHPWMHGRRPADLLERVRGVLA